MRGVKAGKLAVAGLAAFVIAGCAWNVARTPAANEVVARRLVGLPSVGTSYVRDSADQWRTQFEESAQARQRFDESVNYALARADARFFASETSSLLDRYPAFHAWSQSTLRAVLLQTLGRRRAAATQLPEKHLEEWRFEGGLASWRRVLDADFVLLTRFTEGYALDGAKVRPDSSTGINWTIGCVLRLEDGVLVWCSVNHTAKTNLASRAGAQKAVDRLLEGMLARMPVVQPRSSVDRPVAGAASAPSVVSQPPPSPVDAGPDGDASDG